MWLLRYDAVLDKLAHKFIECTKHKVHFCYVEPCSFFCYSLLSIDL